MRTLIELYVNEPYDNLLSAYAFKPEAIVYICTGRYPGVDSQNCIKRFLSGVNPGMDIEFIVGKDDIQGLYSTLLNVINAHDDCALDLTGGTVPALLAAQKLCDSKGVKAFYIDYETDSFVNVLGMENEISQIAMPKLTVPILLAMGGACITGSGHETDSLGEPGVLNCVREVIKVYLKFKDEWSSSVSYLQLAIGKYEKEEDDLDFMAPSSIEKSNGGFIKANAEIFDNLQRAGAISGLRTKNGRISFRFKSYFIKRCLSVTGMWLELLIYISAVDSGLFDDVRMSVEFDWDGVVHGDSRDTRNELDVVLVRGLTPIFVSCKSSEPRADALYEISYLAHRFGGKNAKAVIATAEAISVCARTIYRRALDMGMFVIESDDILDDDVARLLLRLTERG